MKSPAPSKISVDFTVSADRYVPATERVEVLLQFVAQHEDLSGELGVWLCTDEEIADLHLRFMDIPGATDVITFPADDESDYLGDVAVSVDTAAVQASDAGHSAQREVAYLCLHGLLHIAGYDDLDEASQAQMLTRQDELLKKFEETFPGEW
jgi:probable rRNA maturation factor